jgi:hypothetical protein
VSDNSPFDRHSWPRSAYGGDAGAIDYQKIADTPLIRVVMLLQLAGQRRE